MIAGTEPRTLKPAAHEPDFRFDETLGEISSGFNLQFAGPGFQFGSPEWLFFKYGVPLWHGFPFLGLTPSDSCLFGRF